MSENRKGLNKLVLKAGILAGAFGFFYALVELAPYVIGNLGAMSVDARRRHDQRHTIISTRDSGYRIECAKFADPSVGDPNLSGKVMGKVPVAAGGNKLVADSLGKEVFNCKGSELAIVVKDETK